MFWCSSPSSLAHLHFISLLSIHSASHAIHSSHSVSPFCQSSLPSPQPQQQHILQRFSTSVHSKVLFIATNGESLCYKRIKMYTKAQNLFAANANKISTKFIKNQRLSLTLPLLKSWNNKINKMNLLIKFLNSKSL